MGSSNYVHFDFEKIIRETDKALLVRFDGGEEVWVPLSQVADAEDYRAGDEDGEISLTEWFVRQQGWEVT
jgi:hypothetical protein